MSEDQTPQPSSTLRRRDLGRLLRRYRERTGLTIGQAGAQVDLSQSTMSRVERGTTRLRTPTLLALLEMYDVPTAEREQIKELASQAHTRGWWQRSGTLPTRLTSVGGYVGYEADACEVKAYDVALIHGLLQTERYARAQISAAQPILSSADVERAVAVRMRRQLRLTGQPRLRLISLVEQATLTRPVGGAEVTCDQLTHLLRTFSGRTVTIRVLPTSLGAHSGLDGSFSVLRFGADYPDVGYVETRTGPLFLEQAWEVAELMDKYDELRKHALSAAKSRTMIEQAIKEFT